MRFNDQMMICNLMHQNGLQNNNQPQYSPEINQNENNSATIDDEDDNKLQQQQDVSNEEFRLGQDTGVYSSLALTRNNKNNIFIDHNINLDNSYNLSSSAEDLTDCEPYFVARSPHPSEDEEEEDDDDDDDEPDEDNSEWSEYSEDGNLPQGCRGIVNPNYPGFQHLAPSLLSDTDDTTTDDERSDLDDEYEDEYNNNSSNARDTQGNVINRLDLLSLSNAEERRRQIYQQTTFNIHESVGALIECMNKAEFRQEQDVVEVQQLSTKTMQFPQIEEIESKNSSEAEEEAAPSLPPLNNINVNVNVNVNNNSSNKRHDDSMDLIREARSLENLQQQPGLTELQPEVKKLDQIDLLAGLRADDDCEISARQLSVPDVVVEIDNMKNEEKNQMKHRQQQQQQQSRIENESYDVYSTETAMPKIDMDVIESHLKAARDAERRRRTSREEIRRRVAMGPDTDEARSAQGRKPSLQSRLLNGMQMQICFMNENSSDNESLAGLEFSDDASRPASVASSSTSTPAKRQQQQTPKPQPQPQQQPPVQRPQLLEIPPLRPALLPQEYTKPLDEADFFARQARLRMEARLALAQAKDLAHMHMELERQKMKCLPITEMVRASLDKINVQLGEDRRRLTRTLLTDLNVKQLEVLADDLHARIAGLNEALVEGLMLRDELLMEQDSMLVDVEDLTRYLGAKQELLERKMQLQQQKIQQQPVKSQQQQQNSKRKLIAINRPTKLMIGRQMVANLVRK
ncbi:histone-lysine N-methyltransferase, H3 lysine-79 specific [Trichogramma pretiosum]|uniref:histone-lysine N-methyltransferase, H3 lysine-79 specific n=1 Tax=Trichogramma pretiosum TaxID=7493 RepID=UPI0006C9CCB0|nr:histone-lysine N-methyltransferase, H3 lysine-79 specific [Trichogramma pretiosum]